MKIQKVFMYIIGSWAVCSMAPKQIARKIVYSWLRLPSPGPNSCAQIAAFHARHAELEMHHIGPIEIAIQKELDKYAKQTSDKEFDITKCQEGTIRIIRRMNKFHKNKTRELTKDFYELYMIVFALDFMRLYCKYGNIESGDEVAENSKIALEYLKENGIDNNDIDGAESIAEGIFNNWRELLSVDFESCTQKVAECMRKRSGLSLQSIKAAINNVIEKHNAKVDEQRFRIKNQEKPADILKTMLEFRENDVFRREIGYELPAYWHKTFTRIFALHLMRLHCEGIRIKNNPAAKENSTIALEYLSRICSNNEYDAAIVEIILQKILNNWRELPKINAKFLSRIVSTLMFNIGDREDPEGGETISLQSIKAAINNVVEKRNARTHDTQFRINQKTPKGILAEMWTLFGKDKYRLPEYWYETFMRIFALNLVRIYCKYGHIEVHGNLKQHANIVSYYEHVKSKRRPDPQESLDAPCLKKRRHSSYAPSGSEAERYVGSSDDSSSQVYWEDWQDGWKWWNQSADGWYGKNSNGRRDSSPSCSSDGQYEQGQQTSPEKLAPAVDRYIRTLSNNGQPVTFAALQELAVEEGGKLTFVPDGKTFENSLKNYHQGAKERQPVTLRPAAALKQCQ